MNFFIHDVPIPETVQESVIRVNPREQVPLPMIGPAPEITGITEWLNSKPLSLQELRGKVVLIDFWTYSCINCLRTIPYLKEWYKSYKDKGLVIIGVHSPEFPFEQDIDNIKQAVERLGIRYPVAIDNSYATWNAYKNRFWPTHYLIDQNGIIRKMHFGEGGYSEMENAIRSLLGLSVKEEKEKTNLQFQVLTPETYLGFSRAMSYTTSMRVVPNEIVTYSYEGKLGQNQVGLTGLWQVRKDCITAEGDDAVLNINFLAGRVYLVLSGKSEKPLTVLLDGAPLPKQAYTKDMNVQGEIFVGEDRKYDIVDLHGSVERHFLSVHVPKGISAYAFSFGTTT